MSYRKKAEIAVGEDQTYREEKINLWVCYWFDSSYQKTLERLIYVYESMASRILRDSGMIIPPSEKDDCLQVARIALLKAITRFDPNKGVVFYTYARQLIIGDIKHYFRDKFSFVHIPAAVQALKYQLDKNEEVDSELLEGCDYGKQMALQDRFAMVSLDEPALNENEESTSRQILDPNTLEDEIICKTTMEDFTQKLPELDRKVLKEFLKGNSLADIARILGISASFPGRAMKNIREQMSLILLTEG
ncbi:MAG: sigma-70 family RNA polymerase sigma factor [Candidatus Berkelbacteria bacterium]